jgi:ParB-like chromosome segregation protein Spo0J
MPRKKNPAPPPAAGPDLPDLSYIADPLRVLAEPLAKLLPDPENARTHDEDNLRSIVASLRQFGQRKPIVANSRTKTIEAGNGTFEAARRIGWTHLAVVWVEDDPAAARGFSIADNRTAELADWDGLKLETLLAELADDSPSLYAELLLRDLRDKTAADESAAAGAAQPVGDSFAVIVECADEAQQHTVYEQLQGEGLQCRLLTL